MKAVIKSEFKKILTIRSAYVIVILCLVLAFIFAFWAAGIRVIPESLTDPFALSYQVTGAVGTVSLILALIGVFLITHEYRYNTIIYTLSSSNSRAKVLLAKIIVASVVALVLAVLFAVISPLLMLLGLMIKGYDLVPQTIYFLDLLGRSLFYAWGYMMCGLLLGTLMRSQVGAIATLFMAQATVEPLIGLLLKANSFYLPFSVLNSTLTENAEISFGRGVLVFLAYLVVGWVVAFILFIRRDAA